MKRRKFISSSLKGALVPFFVGGLGIHSKATATFMPTGVCDFDDRILVVIHLNGANDIINSTIPLNQLGAYRENRSKIYIPTNKLITLDNSLGDNQQLGLNPSLQSFKSLYDDGLLGIIQRAGYPLPNRSHFAAEAIWLRGDQGGADANENEGWIGRFLRNRYPSYKGLPFGDEQDPLGIMLGGGSDGGYHTNDEHAYHLNLTGQDPAGFYNIISSLSGQPIESFPNTDHGDLLEYISALERSTQVYSDRVTSVFNAGQNVATYPRFGIGAQLKTIAKFISGGSRTKVFFGRMGGWDTHVEAVESTDSTEGRHNMLLENLSDSIKAFQDDLKAQGLSHRVVTVVFSEFGRKVIENDKLGTDHGTLSSMFVVGESVNGGVIGNNINLSEQDSQGAPDPSQLENDYRSVFSSILQDWMGAGNASLRASFPSTAESIINRKIPLIRSSDAVDSSCLFVPKNTGSIKVQVQVHLEGLYDTQTSRMNTHLRQANLIPETQPFDNAFFNYFGDETAETLPANTVDWLLLELRAKDTYTVVARKAVLLMADGTVRDTNGQETIEFANIFHDNYHLCILHATHLGIMTTATTSTVATVTNSFIIDQESKVLGTNQLKQKGGKVVMIAGDIDQNGSINSADMGQIIRQQGKSGYYAADLNRSGAIENSDTDLIKTNGSRIGYPKLFSQLKL